MVVRVMFARGRLYASGNFTVAGSNAAAFLAELHTDCPAGVTNTATACAGSSGPIALTAVTDPWIGSTLETRATGFAAGALIASVVGFTSPGTPLSVFSPMAGPGCHLLASVDAVSLVISASGVGMYAIPIPNNSSLANVVLQQQFLQLELGPTPLLSASNGLTITIGEF